MAGSRQTINDDIIKDEVLRERIRSTAIANGLYLYVTRSKNQLSQEQTDEIERSIRCNCDLPERQ
jgi:hypothetical protein